MINCYNEITVLENIFQIIKQTSFSLVLTDSEGVLIFVIESENIHFKHNTLNFVLGTHWDEQNVGANAIGTALAMNDAIHMVGSEHFCQAHHPWTCSAALIHNSVGEVIGCLDISGSVEDDHIHTFGIVTTAANIIEKQLALMGSNNLMDSAINAVLDGMFVIDTDFHITHMNDKIIEMFKIDRKSFMELDFRTILEDVEISTEVFKKGKDIRYSDYSIHYGDKKLECLINISPIKVAKSVKGAVIVCKEAKQVRKVVSRIAGFNATYTFDDIMTQDERMMNILNFAKKIARTDSTVLIQGESGTGKELMAHAIHSESRRSEGPFIAINCAALPKDLAESELFGYEKGAFTGASIEGKPGKFELANGGTIFLDEIGELPLEIQSKLLRVLDNKKITRIGGNHQRRLDVRILTATNRNLEDEVRLKSFREDLYFRLNVIKVQLIPLRERKKDILPFSEFFLNQLIEENAGNTKVFTQRFKDSLLENAWKGNIRELRYHIQREYYLSEAEVIDTVPMFEKTTHEMKDIKNENLRDVERVCIIEALKATNGNVVDASKRLDVGKSTIYRKIKTFNINSNEYKI
jgi:transcriptional regulator with PAS, ATPase and Fis domain